MLPKRRAMETTQQQIGAAAADLRVPVHHVGAFVGIATGRQLDAEGQATGQASEKPV